MRPIVLVILDGWGLSPEIKGNAILSTPTPNLDFLMSNFPYASLHASGEEVGLPWGEIGNSEVGHFNLGTGRIVLQDLERINRSIQEGTFFKNKVLQEAYYFASTRNSNLHLIGLFSSGGVHSHMNHLFALLDLAKKYNFTRIFIHLITDGRDTAPRIVLADLKKLEEKIQAVGIGQIASVMGRYFAMDRDKHFDRTNRAYSALVGENTSEFITPEEAIEFNYKQNLSDEFIVPSRLKNMPKIMPNDAIIFYNFRSDRARQLSDIIIEQKNNFFVSFTSYGHEPTPIVKSAFFSPKIDNFLGLVLEKEKISHLHIAETEKYPHVTYFFNGGSEEKLGLEERIIVPSLKVATYDLRPDMSALEITNNFIDFFKRQRPTFTVLNYANADMVGHTGSFEATQKAIAFVDDNLGKLAGFVLKEEADLIVTADHGNAEQMINLQTGEIDKEHTTNPVPVILAFQHQKKQIKDKIDINAKIMLAARNPVGVLADIAPTILDRLEIEIPKEITGKSLEGYL